MTNETKLLRFATDQFKFAVLFACNAERAGRVRSFGIRTDTTAVRLDLYDHITLNIHIYYLKAGENLHLYLRTTPNMIEYNTIHCLEPEPEKSTISLNSKMNKCPKTLHWNMNLTNIMCPKMNALREYMQYLQNQVRLRYGEMTQFNRFFHVNL